MAFSGLTRVIIWRNKLKVIVVVVLLATGSYCMAMRPDPEHSVVPAGPEDDLTSASSYTRVSGSSFAGAYANTDATLEEALAHYHDLTLSERTAIRNFFSSLRAAISNGGEFTGARAWNASISDAGLYSNRGGTCTDVAEVVSQTISTQIGSFGDSRFTSGGYTLVWWLSGFTVWEQRGAARLPLPRSTSRIFNHVSNSVTFTSDLGRSYQFVFDTTITQFNNILRSEFVAILPPLQWAEAIAARTNPSRNRSRQVWMVDRRYSSSMIRYIGPPVASEPPSNLRCVAQ